MVSGYIPSCAGAFRVRVGVVDGIEILTTTWF